MNQNNLSENSAELSSEDQSDEEYAWISYFCSLKGHEFFCEVDVDYIQDNFNLTGLAAQIPYYEFALDVILDVESNEDHLTEEQQEMIEREAEGLYGLIHARYLLTKRGLHCMYEKYRSAEFGRCPRFFCQGQPTLPCGLSDVPGRHSVKTFCPKCEDVFNPKIPKCKISYSCFHLRVFVLIPIHFLM